MPRDKVKVAFITNDSARKRYFMKRKTGFNKKLNELSTLCGVDACAIVYSNYEPQPEVWPNHLGVQQVLAQFQNMPVMNQFKKMVNQESYIRERIKKADAELKKQINKNWLEEMTAVMYECLNGKVSLDKLSTKNLNDLGLLVDQKLSEIDSRIESLKKLPVPADPARLSQPHQPQQDHMMSGGMPGHELSLETQPTDGNLEMMNMMQTPTSFMDLIMGAEET